MVLAGYDYLDLIYETSSICPDLSPVIFEDSVYVYADGSFSKTEDNTFYCSYSVFSLPDIIWELHDIWLITL